MEAWTCSYSKKPVDHLLNNSTLEKKIFEKYEVPTTFVGHPITEINIENLKTIKLKQDREVFLILPGSRKRKLYLFYQLLK